MARDEAHATDEALSPDALKGYRILLGPGDTASFPSRLARGLAEHGAQCWVLNFSQHIYNADPSTYGRAKLWAPRWVRTIAWLEKRGILGIIAGGILKEVLRVITFIWSLLAINTVVFVSSRSLFRSNIDLWFYKKLGKRVIRVFLGSDSRPRYMSGWHHPLLDDDNRPAAAIKLANRVKRQYRRVNRLTNWSSVVVDNPLCGHYHTRPYVNWFFIGFPHDESTFGGAPQDVDDGAQDRNEPLRILHCPSNPTIKGTEQIEAGIQKLKDSNANIEYTRITGMPRLEVLERLSQCDLVIDQMYSDSPMAGFASEAAAFGKPSIVCGYPWELLRTYLPEGSYPPNLLMTPEAFDDALPKIVADAERRRKVGRQAYDFINSEWSQAAVVRRFAKVIAGDDDIPEPWWFDPKQIAYWQGLGATAEHRQAVLTAYCREQGIESLMAPDGSPFLQTVKSWLAETPAHESSD